MRKWIGVGILSVATLIGGALWARAQSQPTMLSGGDIAFRVDRWDGDIPVGRWVVKTEGRWVEPRTAGLRRLAAH